MAEEVVLESLLDGLARPFRHEAETRHLSLDIQVDPGLGRTMVTDSKRLQQVLKNLLSNAFKFTEQGGVRLRVTSRGDRLELRTIRCCKRAASVVAFEVADTGIGIPQEKQRIIFEAFQQADAGTSRKYGGTGLGLAISRELATLLGGEIQLRSVPGLGSTFTLYLPQTYVGACRPSGLERGARRPRRRVARCAAAFPRASGSGTGRPKRSPMTGSNLVPGDRSC